MSRDANNDASNDANNDAYDDGRTKDPSARPSALYLIDYVGEGTYRAMKLVDDEDPELFASSDSPMDLLTFVMQNAMPGQNVCVSPVVAAIQALCNPVVLNTMLQSADVDPFLPSERVIRVPAPDEQAALIDVLKQAFKDMLQDETDQAATQGADSSATGVCNSEAVGDGQSSDVSPRIKPKFERKPKRGGRIGWLFDMDCDCPTAKKPDALQQDGTEGGAGDKMKGDSSGAHDAPPEAN